MNDDFFFFCPFLSGTTWNYAFESGTSLLFPEVFCWCSCRLSLFFQSAPTWEKFRELIESTMGHPQRKLSNELQVTTKYTHTIHTVGCLFEKAHKTRFSRQRIFAHSLHVSQRGRKRQQLIFFFEIPFVFSWKIYFSTRTHRSTHTRSQIVWGEKVGKYFYGKQTTYCCLFVRLFCWCSHTNGKFLRT